MEGGCLRLSSGDRRRSFRRVRFWRAKSPRSSYLVWITGILIDMGNWAKLYYGDGILGYSGFSQSSGRSPNRNSHIFTVQAAPGVMCRMTPNGGGDWDP